VTRARPVGLLLACTLLAGCSAAQSPSPGAGEPEASRVDVDTPELRAAKEAAGVEPCLPGSAAPAEDGLPDVTLPCLGGGRPVRLPTLRGPMVVNLFAQWCGPCRAELPYYQRLHQEAKGKVSVLGVDYLDTQPAAALQLVDDSGVTYPLLADPDGALRSELKVRGLPGMVFVDAAGKVTDVQFRVVESYAELRGLVEQELGVDLPA
jgi:thiol-disulfide isomerase/thioredoxin